MKYLNPSGSEISYSTLLIRNYNWPGSATVYKQGEWSYIYIGFGIRKNSNNFYPLIPKLIGKDPEGKTEYREPNPDKEPEIIEPDTDEEKDPNENENNNDN